MSFFSDTTVGSLRIPTRRPLPERNTADPSVLIVMAVEVQELTQDRNALFMSLFDEQYIAEISNSNYVESDWLPVAASALAEKRKQEHDVLHNVDEERLIPSRIPRFKYRKIPGNPRIFLS